MDSTVCPTNFVRALAWLYTLEFEAKSGKHPFSSGLAHSVPSEFQFQFLALFVQQNFLKISKLILHFLIQGLYIFFVQDKEKVNSFRILGVLHLMVKFVFQKI